MVVAGRSVGRMYSNGRRRNTRISSHS